MKWKDSPITYQFSGYRNPNKPAYINPHTLKIVVSNHETVEDEIEAILEHEFIHIALIKMFSIDTSLLLDNIHKMGKITKVGRFLERTS